MIAPPRPPLPDALEALIKEARARQLRRRLLGSVAAAIAAALGLSIYAIVTGGSVGGVAPASAGHATGPLCRASQLSASVALQGATQSLAGGATITNTGGGSCSLPRPRPIVRIELKGHTLAIRERPFPYRISGRRVHVLMPGGQATILMQWWNWCGRTGDATMALRLGPGLDLVAPQRLGEPTCIGTGRRSSSTLWVSPPVSEQ